ncbi:MAG: hypothetical protein EAZ43_00580 [Betaproteobacteria bacterium]|nr:MAG: hypothetical protein EAZ43_00580 [Betaproteobacteria bacterium]
MFGKVVQSASLIGAIIRKPTTTNPKNLCQSAKSAKSVSKKCHACQELLPWATKPAPNQNLSTQISLISHRFTQIFLIDQAAKRALLSDAVGSRRFKTNPKNLCQSALICEICVKEKCHACQELLPWATKPAPNQNLSTQISLISHRLTQIFFSIDQAAKRALLFDAVGSSRFKTNPKNLC